MFKTKYYFKAIFWEQNQFDHNKSADKLKCFGEKQPDNKQQKFIPNEKI